MRIGTWNLEHSSPPKTARQRERLLEAAADIWVLTETRDGVDLSPTHRPVHSDSRPKTRADGRWVSIWSRFPTKKITVRDPSRTVCALLDAGPAGDLIVYGTVMPWCNDRGPAGTSKGWEEQPGAIAAQAAEWKELREKFPAAALCVAGDYNMNLGGAHYYGTKAGRDQLQAGLAAAGLACVTRTEKVPTGWLAYPPIDHVAVNAAWEASARVVKAWPGTIDGVRLSDHSAVVVEVAAKGS